MSSNHMYQIQLIFFCFFSFFVIIFRLQPCACVFTAEDAKCFFHHVESKKTFTPSVIVRDNTTHIEITR